MESKIQHDELATCQYYLSKAKAHLVKQKHTESLHVVQLGLQKFPNELSLLLTAFDICQSSGDFDCCIQYARQLIDRHPTNWEGYVFAARSFLALKKRNQAKEVILSGLLVLPEDFQMLLIACRVLEASADFTDALECAQRVIALHPKKWQGYYWAAKVCFSNGSYESAERHVNFALSLKQDPVSYTHLTLPTIYSV